MGGGGGFKFLGVLFFFFDFVVVEVFGWGLVGGFIDCWEVGGILFL